MTKAKYDNKMLVKQYLEEKNETSFNLLLTQNKPNITTLAFQITGSSEAAKDIYQDVSIKLWKKLKKFDSRVDIGCNIFI
jgi:DNA-directed RNA polymerase specialized sigma24 family protein